MKRSHGFSNVHNAKGSIDAWCAKWIRRSAPLSRAIQKKKRPVEGAFSSSRYWSDNSPPQAVQAHAAPCNGIARMPRCT
jgi:hypothetical protein